MSIQHAIAAVDDNPWKQAKLSVNGNTVELGRSLVLLRGQENEVTVEVDPEIAEMLNLVLGDDGGMRIEANPPFGEWVNPIDNKFSWKITPEDGKSGLALFVFFSRETAIPLECSSAVVSADLNNEVAEFKIGENILPVASMFFIDESKTATITPKEGSPLQHIDLVFDAIPRGGPPTMIVTPSGPGRSLAWEITATGKSGWFSPFVRDVNSTTSYIVRDHKVMSRNLADEVQDVLLNGVVYAIGCVINIDESYVITLSVVPGSPLLEHPHPMTLTVILISGLAPGDVVVVKNPGNTSWTLTASKPGEFKLELAGTLMTGIITLPDTIVQ